MRGRGSEVLEMHGAFLATWQTQYSVTSHNIVLNDFSKVREYSSYDDMR